MTLFPSRNAQPASAPFSWISALILVAATVICYLPALTAGFIWDDPLLLTENPLIRAPDGLWQIWIGGKAPDFFPLTYTNFWFEWRLFGENATGYHAVNIGLHAACAVLLWRILAALNVPGALFAGLLFAVHPVNAASVAWIAERKNTLSMFFFLASLLCWLRDEKTAHRRFYWIALVTFLCALLSKTSVVTLPVVFLGLAWWQRGRISRRDLQRTIPFFAASLILGVLTVVFQHRDFTSTTLQDPLAFRVARAGWIVGFYAVKAVWPFPLCLVYPKWDLDLHAPLTWLPVVLLVVFFGGLLWLSRKPWARHVLMGAGYFVVMLLPVCGFVSMTFFDQAWVADWWMYSALPGLLALIAGAGATISRHGGWKQVVVRTLGILVLLGLGSLTWLEARTYESLEINCRHTLACNPLAWGARNNLARELTADGRVEEALQLYREGLRLQPDQKLTLDNLGRTLVTERRFEEALPHCRRVVELNPGYASGHNTLAGALTGLGRFDESVPEFREAVRLQPTRIDYRVNLIRVLVRMGRIEIATSETRTALQAAQMTGQTQQVPELSALLDSLEKAREELNKR